MGLIEVYDSIISVDAKMMESILKKIYKDEN
jgi:hypothetical protein